MLKNVSLIPAGMPVPVTAGTAVTLVDAHIEVGEMSSPSVISAATTSTSPISSRRTVPSIMPGCTDDTTDCAEYVVMELT